MNDLAVQLDDVSVKFRVPMDDAPTLKESMIAWMDGRGGTTDVWALRDVSLQVHRGEILGLIGHNGAGKSTLLRLIAQVLRPTSGRVRVRGRLAPLLDLGAGFHAELTGRENVVMTGTMLGFSRAQIESRLPDIIAFCGLERFIDAPVRTYSSGMWARLAFAVATDARPDLLVIDEILSVGDEDFRERSQHRLDELMTGGTTVLLVTHDLTTVLTRCHRAALLDHGRLLACGAPADVIARYRNQPRAS